MRRLSRPRMPVPCLAARRVRRQPRRAGEAAGAASEQRERRGRAVAAAGRKWRFFYLYVKDPRGGANAKPFGQAGQHAHDQLHRRLFAMKHRAMMFGEIALARGAVELPPGAATGMAIGAQVGQPRPTAIITIAVGTEMHRGVNGTGTAVGGRHGIGPYRRCWGTLSGRLLTQGTVGLVRQACERFRFTGASAFGLDGLGWCLERSIGWAWPEVGQHHAQPEQDQDD